MATNNSSALLDLPNVQTDLPTPLMPQVSQTMMEARDERTENAQQPDQVQTQLPAIKYWNLFRTLQE